MSSKETPKDRVKKGEVSFVVDRAGVKSAHAADDALTKHHRLPIRYTSNLPVQKPTDHTKETKNESVTSCSKGRLARPYGRGPENIPRKHFLRTQSLSDRHSTSKTATAKRYHAEDDPRFSALKPGIISEALRDALGITNHQLPLYIYNMRQLGYPPGHLENARRQQSGILIFTNDGCEVTPHGKILEEGEVNDEQEEVLFDVDKLIDFPGFNMNPPDGTIDECERLDLPFMQTDQSKEEMWRLLSSAQPGKESSNGTKQSLEESCVKKRDNSQTIQFGGQADSKADEKRKSDLESGKMAIWLSEMGLCAADGWLVLDALPELDEEDDDHCVWGSTCLNSSSVERNSPNRSLPSRQSETRRSVEDMIVPNVSVSLDLPTEKTSCHALPSSSQGSRVSPEPRLDIGGSGEDCVMPVSSDFEWKNSSAYGGSLDVTPGTPLVVVDTMVWSKGLPDASSFSSGMSEPLPYENLPNATGAFRKLRTVLAAARKRTSVY